MKKISFRPGRAAVFWTNDLKPASDRVVIADETHQSCGVGAEIAARIAESGFDKLKAPIRRVATLDVPVPYSPPLEEAFLPQVKDIVATARKLAAY